MIAVSGTWARVVPPVVPPGQMSAGNRVLWRRGDEDRAGNVWSAGPEPRTLWAIPDGPYGDRKPVLIRYRTRGGAHYEETR